MKVSGEMRGMNPFEVEEALSREIGGKPNRISGSGRDSFMVEVNSKQEAEIIKNMKTLCEREYQVVAHQFFNGSKGLVFLINYNAEDMGMRQVNLLQEHGMTNIEEGKWITPRNKTAKAFLVLFKGAASHNRFELRENMP